MSKSPITLFELITELKNIEKEERRRRRMSDGSGDLTDALLIDADDVVSIAHEEGFQEILHGPARGIPRRAGD